MFFLPNSEDPDEMMQGVHFLQLYKKNRQGQKYIFL